MQQFLDHLTKDAMPALMIGCPKILVEKFSTFLHIPFNANLLPFPYQSSSVFVVWLVAS
jgi:hypothetical protein